MIRWTGSMDLKLRTEPRKFAQPFECCRKDCRPKPGAALRAPYLARVYYEPYGYDPIYVECLEHTVCRKAVRMGLFCSNCHWSVAIPNARFECQG